MGNLIDNICKLRDILNSKNYKILAYRHGLMESIKNEVHRQVRKKINILFPTGENNNINTTEELKERARAYELDFTSQDLRELAQDIRSVLKRWDNIMNPEKNIKAMFKDKSKCVNLDECWKKLTPIMIARNNNSQVLIALLNILEHHAILLYSIEEYLQEDFALNYTERFD